MGNLVAGRRRRRVVTMVAGTVLLVAAVALSLPRAPAAGGEIPVKPAASGEVPAVDMGDARLAAALAAVLAQVSPPAPRTPSTSGQRPGSRLVAASNRSLDVQRALNARRDIHRLSAEDIQRCLEVAREVDPQLAQRLEDLQRESPGPAFERAIAGARYLRALANLKQRDPQLYNVKIMELQTDANIDGLLQEFRELRRDGIASAGLEARLHALVRVQVGYSIAARGMALRRLTEHVQEVTEKLAEDSKNFEKTVRHSLRELLEQPGDAPGQNDPAG